MEHITVDGIQYKQVAEARAYYVSECGKVYSTYKEGRVLSPGLHNLGYLQVFLNLNNGERKWRKVHRLVASAYLPNPESKRTVNHIDHDPANNSVSNLEWATHQENTQHSVRAGRMQINQGAAHYNHGKHLSRETRDKCSAAKLGENHPRFSGWYVTPAGEFASANAAGAALNLSGSTVHKRIKAGAAGYSFRPK